MAVEPLRGIEVLDLATMTPGKYCSCLLADLGASVLRVERPGGRPRSISDEDLVLNRGKRSLCLDLRSERGRDLLYRLCARSDVVIESNRPGVAARLGIGYGDLRKHADRLVYCSLSGFGQKGPYRDRPAYDLILMALSGALRALVGQQVAPFPPGLYLADTVSGLCAAFAIAVALLRRERSGEGGYVDLAMFDSIFSLLATSHGLERDARAADAGAAGAAGATFSPLYRIYETAEGGHVALAAIREKSCRALFESLGRPELAARARSSPDDAASAEIEAFLERSFKAATAAQWYERLAPLDIEIAPLRAPHEVFSDPQLLARHMLLDSTHPQAGTLRMIATPLCARAAGPAGTPPPAPPRPPAPAIGADSDEVLRELGLAEREIDELRDRGVI